MIQALFVVGVAADVLGGVDVVGGVGVVGAEEAPKVVLPVKKKMGKNKWRLMRLQNLQKKKHLTTRRELRPIAKMNRDDTWMLKVPTP